MKRLTDADRKRIDNLHAEGKSVNDITKIIKEFSYTAIWQHVNRETVLEKSKQRYAETPKIVNTPSTLKYVETGRPMPPISPPSKMTIIIDKELAELRCQQLGLKPPVTTLANRPHNISHHGMKFIDGKWVANQDMNNNGIVRYYSSLRNGT